VVRGADACVTVSEEDVLGVDVPPVACEPLPEDAAVPKLPVLDAVPAALEDAAPPGPRATTAPHTAMNTTRVATATDRRREATRWVREICMDSNVAPAPE
jgi:hypothetical protein